MSAKVITGTSYTAVQTDFSSLLTFTNNAASTLNLPSATNAWLVLRYVDVSYLGTGSLTIQPGAGVTIDGLSSLTISTPYNGLRIFFDGTNYETQRGDGSGGSGDRLSNFVNTPFAPANLANCKVNTWNEITTSVSYQVFLPTTGLAIGNVIGVRVTSTSTGVLTVSPTPSGSIGFPNSLGILSSLLMTSGMVAELEWDGSQWNVLTFTTSADSCTALMNAPNTITNVSGTLNKNILNIVKNTSAGTITLTIPAVNAQDKISVVIDSASTALCQLSGTINGVANKILWAGEAFSAEYDGTSWRLLWCVLKPMVCSMHCSTAQTFLNATSATVLLDTTDLDNTGLMANTGSNEIVIQRPGNYVVMGSIPYNTTVQARYDASLRKNVTVVIEYNFATGGANYPNPICFYQNTFAAGDDITLLGGQFSGGSVNLFVSAGVNGKLAVHELPAW